MNKNLVFMAFVRKEFYHIFRDRWTMVILLLMPVVMLLLFGYALNTEVKNSRMVVYDPSNDEVTRAIIEKLQVNGYFILREVLSNPEDIETCFQKGETDMVLVFSPNFHENMLHTGDAQIQLIADGSDPNMATTLTTYASTIISSYQQELLKTGKIPYQITPEIKLLYNPTMKAAYNFVPGVMGMILLLICAMMTSVSIAREKENGTMEILLVSPMRPLYVILSKVIPYFLLSLVNLTTILFIAVFVMHVPIAGSFFWLIVISLLYIFVALALGLLISSAVSSQMAAMLISGLALMMPVMLLSGMIFPVENMPVPLQVISNVVPAKWYILAVKKLMIKGLGFASIYQELSVLGMMAVVLVTVSLRKFKIRLE
ncbi:MAG: ABC transporter permease [Bacteroidales bacterium]|nr:ABC transporter permease [Bacteroidales bacterium]